MLVTGDRNLEHQQNLTGRSIGIVIVSTNRWAWIRAAPGPIRTAVEEAARLRAVTRIELGRPPPAEAKQEPRP